LLWKRECIARLDTVLGTRLAGIYIVLGIRLAGDFVFGFADLGPAVTEG